MDKGSENIAEISVKLNFSKQLQVVTNKVHATSNIDEIMLEVSQDICTLFNADRLTIYSVSEDKSSIVSKVKTGLNSFKDLKLPIAEQSVAGYVALHKRMVNIRDVYDDRELQSYSPQLHFLKEVDKRTGYRTKQMLVGPIADANNGDLIGVVQIINSHLGQPFPPMAEEGLTELTKTLAIAMRQRQRPQQLVIRSKYDYLVVDNAISSVDIEAARQKARDASLDLEEVLINDYSVKVEQIGNSLSRFYGVPYEPFKPERVKPAELLKNLKREYAESVFWVPVDEDQSGMIVLTTDPERVQGSRNVNMLFPKHKVQYRVATHRDFLNTLNQFFGGGGAGAGGMQADDTSIGDLLEGLGEDMEEGPRVDDDVSAAADNELVKLVNKIIVDAKNMEASDIHIEPYPGKAKTIIRFRKDGTLMNYIEVPAHYRNPLVTRLKIMCDLDISEKRKPQDGKIKFKKFGPLDIELRVATIPTQGGVEDVVMRILAAGEPIPLDNLGLTKHNLTTLKDVVSKPYGLFFVCGPTGSGKTTTLHSVLGFLNTVETKIWTAEDPVEITQRGLRQVQMNVKAGLTFAVAMKAFLRADPDIIMVGEMRDKETVSTGIEASLTGHLVFATLHTNSAPESIIRLLDMGMDPFNFADALLGVLAQRLAKRLCSKCKKPHPVSEDEIKRFLNEYCEELKNAESFKKNPSQSYKDIYQDWVKNYGNDKGQLVFYEPVGCDHCANTGYRGRVGLHELLVGTDRLKKNIQEHARVAEMFLTAMEDGMRTLKQDGMEKVLMGITDMKQVRSVCIK